MSQQQQQISMNFYKVLDLHETASIEEIKKSYRKMVLKYHPDLNKNPLAVRKLQDIIKAYKTLSDPEKRVEYDKTFLKNFKIYNSFPNINKEPTEKQKPPQTKVKKEPHNKENLFSKIKIGFKIFRTKITNSFTKLPELIVADKKLLKIPIAELKERFYTSENKYVRCEALKAIVVLLGRKSYPEIEKGFDDISKDVRCVSIKAVGFLLVRQGLQHLERLYLTSGVSLRKAIVESVSRFPNNERAKKLILTACQDKESEIRIESLKAFKRLEMGDYINRISYLVYDRNEEVRKLARELYEVHKEN